MTQLDSGSSRSLSITVKGSSTRFTLNRKTKEKFLIPVQKDAQALSYDLGVATINAINGGQQFCNIADIKVTFVDTGVVTLHIRVTTYGWYLVQGGAMHLTPLIQTQAGYGNLPNVEFGALPTDCSWGSWETGHIPDLHPGSFDASLFNSLCGAELLIDESSWKSCEG